MHLHHHNPRNTVTTAHAKEIKMADSQTGLKHFRQRMGGVGQPSSRRNRRPATGEWLSPFHRRIADDCHCRWNARSSRDYCDRDTSDPRSGKNAKTSCIYISSYLCLFRILFKMRGISTAPMYVHTLWMYESEVSIAPLIKDPSSYDNELLTHPHPYQSSNHNIPLIIKWSHNAIILIIQNIINQKVLGDWSKDMEIIPSRRSIRGTRDIHTWYFCHLDHPKYP